MLISQTQSPIPFIGASSSVDAISRMGQTRHRPLSSRLARLQQHCISIEQLRSQQISLLWCHGATFVSTLQYSAHCGYLAFIAAPQGISRPAVTRIGGTVPRLWLPQTLVDKTAGSAGGMMARSMPGLDGGSAAYLIKTSLLFLQKR
jgi:hypothetical protein